MECLYSSDYQSNRVFNSDRVQGTCQWVLHHRTYQQWRQEQQPSLLWVSADPGCGKFFLASFLIDELESVDSQSTLPGAVCFFFFKDNAEQSSATLSLRAMIHQLFTAKPSLIHIAAVLSTNSTIRILFANILIGQIYSTIRIVEYSPNSIRTKIPNYYKMKQFLTKMTSLSSLLLSHSSINALSSYRYYSIYKN
jgi:hypothetical protein